jgi:hypothetical protein
MPGEGGATTRWRPTVINQDIDGNVPPETAAGASGTPKGAPETLEQQLEREREARVLMRERLRTTEALAAESHALRARMAQELERVTADRDRLRIEAETAAAPAVAEPAMRAAAPASVPRHAAARAVEPPLTSGTLPPKAAHADDRPLKPPVPARRKGPWGALTMLSVVAVAVGALAWYKGSLPGLKELQSALDPPAPAAAAAANREAAPAAPSARPPAVAPLPTPAAVARASPPSGPVALPPVTPDAQLAAAPSAAGPVATAAPAGMSTADMAARLRKALDGEGIASPVDVDAASGRVQVTDPKADDALRQRTEMVIRAVYAGASLPEPQIEHRWLSPMHGARETVAATDAPAVKATVAAPAAPSPDTVTAGRHAAVARGQEHRRATEVSVAAAEELTPVLPAGRVTAACMDGLVGRSAARRANLTACMKHSCCSSAANHNSEECRAYERAYPFTCSAG